LEPELSAPSPADIRRAAAAGAGLVRETPVLSSRTLGERCGGTIALKTENLQRTGSFKLRGALAKLAALGDRCVAGVVTASAGNHAQAVAYAAKARGVPCEVFMPEIAPISKIEAVTALGARVSFAGVSVEECLSAAHERAASGELAFVHPFDDVDVIAGQGTIGLELLAQIDDLSLVVVPIGGGGLASGVAIALKAEVPGIRVVGVQVESYASVAASLEAGHPLAVLPALTIADGIAVKHPGELTLPLLARWVDEVVVVSEDEVAEAMAFLLVRAKLVVEGAGAVGVAALLAGRVAGATSGTTAAILSGGNVDAGLVAQIARRHETQAGRRLVVLARIPDRPGSLARLLRLVGAAGANLLDVQHVREGIELHVRETAVQTVLETRGREHSDEVVRVIRESGYEPRVVVR